MGIGWIGKGAAAVAAAMACTAAAPGSTVKVVTMADMKFGAVPAALRVGDTIEWRNDDIFRHTATARDASFDVDLAPKAHARVTLKKAGTVAFFCRFHPGMTGKLVVQPK